MRSILEVVVFLLCIVRFSHSTPKSSPNWEELISTDGVKFSGRNAHASCVYNGSIWLTGGRTAKFVTWNLLDAFKVGDVWRTENGAIWKQEEELKGDFFAQNTEVTQPGPIAPWYQRYGHSLNAIDTDDDGEDDMMILLGGYASSPSNDIWVTRDGVYWIYCGEAPWSPRAWHSTVVFKSKLWLMGGTPLNNEVWMLVNVTQIPRREPLTRSTFSPFTYELKWQQYPDAAWSPRVGMGLVSHWYFNSSDGEEFADSRERMVLAGGYGGWPPVDPNVAKYDGFVTRPDTWESYDGYNWTLLNWNNTFQGRAWMGMEVMHDLDPRVHYPHKNTSEPPKMYIFGGGYIGFRTNSRKRVNTVQAKADGYWSQDGANWIKINYEEGGGTTTVPFFSSQEWASTIVDTAQKYIGRWGLTLHSFNAVTRKQFPGQLHLLAGDFTEGGEYASSVYRSLNGIYCDINGVICNNHGTCAEGQCSCAKGYTPPYCTGATIGGGGTVSAAASHMQLLRASAAYAVLSSALLLSMTAAL